MLSAWRLSRLASVLRLRSAVTIAVLAAGLACAVAVSSARGASTITILDSLNGVPTTSVFPLAGGSAIISIQFAGPEFTLTQTTTVTEVGGFIAVLSGPIVVYIVPAVNGLPDPSHILGTFPITVSPPLPYPQAAYESVAPNLTLPPGTYFALFGGPDLAGATWWGESTTGLMAPSITAGIWDPTNDQPIHAGPLPLGARILGVVADSSALFEELLANVTGLPPGTSLADKVKLAQNYAATNDVPDACSTLSAFINEVKAQSGKKIPASQASTLIASAQQIRTQLGC